MLDTLKSQTPLLQSIAIWSLLAMACYVCIVGLKRVVRMRRMEAATHALLGTLGETLSHQRINAAIAACRNSPVSHLAKVVLAGLLELKQARSIAMPEPEAVLCAREGMDRTGIVLVAEARERLGLIDAIGRTAPFVGVVAGTVNAVAAGTLLALLSIWWSVVLKARSERMEAEVKLFASELRAFLGWHGQCSVCKSQVRNIHKGKSYLCAACCPCTNA